MTAILLLVLNASALAAPLEAHLESALASNPGVRAEVETAEAARARVGRARAALLPQVSVAGGYTRNQYAAEATIPVGPTETQTFVITPIDQLQASVRLDLALLDLQAVFSAASAGRCADASVSRATRAGSQLLRDVGRTYWQTLAAAQVEEAAREAVAAATMSLERVRNREEAGLATTLDRLRAEADLAAARQTYTNAATERASLDRRLRTLSGLEGGADLDAAPREIPEVDIESALAARADLLALRATEACQRLTRTAATMGYAPRISGFAQEQVTNATGFIGQAASWQAGVQLRWTLFDGLGRESAIAEAGAAEQEARARLEEATARARDELTDAIARYQASAAALSAAEARLAAANEALETANDLVEVGRATRVELSLASRDAYDARVGLARAKADRAIASEDLRFLAGLPMVGGTP